VSWEVVFLDGFADDILGHAVGVDVGCPFMSVCPSMHVLREPRTCIPRRDTFIVSGLEQRERFFLFDDPRLPATREL